MTAELAGAYPETFATEPVLRITAHRVPEADAPYDDRVPVPTHGALALAPYVPSAHPPVLRLVTEAEPDLEDDGEFDAVRTPRKELENPAPRAALLARALLEALCGVRPLHQLARWTTPDVFEQLEPHVATRGHRPWAATVRRVIVTEPTPGIAEVTAVVQRGPRAGAVAMRLEGLDGRWLVTALQLG